MKCICGFDDTEKVEGIGKRAFKKIKPIVHIECDANNGGTHLEEVNLFACPICYTVKLKRW